MRLRIRSMLPVFACFLFELACLVPVSAYCQSIAPGVGRPKGHKVTAQAIPLSPANAKVIQQPSNSPAADLAAADLTTSPAADTQGNVNIDLGFIPFGQQSDIQTLTIMNSSTKTYTIGVKSTTGTLKGLDITPCTNGIVVQGTPCPIIFKFSPEWEQESAPSLNGTIVIEAKDKASDSTQEFTIKPAAVLTHYSASVPSTLDGVANGDSAYQTVRVIDHLKKAKAPNVTSIVFVGTNASDFSTSDCKKNPVHEDECDIHVTYLAPLPSASGTANLRITIENKDYVITLNGQAQSCVSPNDKWFPLRRAKAQTIYCFYNASSGFAFASQIRYLYNPAGSANVFSGDLMSAQAPGLLLGSQLSFEGNATTSSCTTTADGSGESVVHPHDDPTTPSSDTCNATGDGNNTPSTQQVVESLEKGGDFALKATMPLWSYNNNYIQTLLVLSPRVGFTVNGLSNQNTVTNGTEANYFIPFEGYLQFGLLPSQTQNDSVASIFADYRAGLESTSVDFAKNAGLASHNFFLQYLSFGIAFNSSVRISGQRYIGPSQSFLDSTGKPMNNFKSWQIGIQFTPTNVSH